MIFRSHTFYIFLSWWDLVKLQIFNLAATVHATTLQENLDIEAKMVGNLLQIKLFLNLGSWLI